MPQKNKAAAKKPKSLSAHLRALEAEALKRSSYDMLSEGVYAGILKNGFIKSFEFAAYANRKRPRHVDEGAFFMASALRGICEDLIALKFLHQLPRPLRDEVVMIDVMLANIKTSNEQAKFFKEVRPFQPVLTLQNDVTAINKMKDRLTEIGGTSGLWKVEKKLPPIEQMANAVGLKATYDYFYRVTSDTVHFNPRIELRNGWGKSPDKSRFGAKNFSRYYLFFSQVYSIFLFNAFCHSFKEELGLDDQFMKDLSGLEGTLNKINRWPEALTFEEMNRPSPNIILRAALQAAHESKREQKRESRAKSSST